MSAQCDVFVVEDDVWLAEQYLRTLTVAGFTASHATSGHIAMQMIDQTPPKVMIVDVLLTGGTAMTLLHELQSYTDTAGIPVILCTNLASQVQLKDVSHYGVRRVLDKTTMQPDDIVTAVRSVLV